MKQRIVFRITLTFFLLINTSKIWDAYLGGWAMILFLLLFGVFFLLCYLLVVEIVKLFIEDLKRGKRLWLIGFMVFVLISSYLFPTGMVNFNKFKAESLLLAQREGVANCMTTLNLRKDNTFTERNVCFGVKETSGNYKISGDTVYFENITLGRGDSAYFEFAILKNQHPWTGHKKSIVRYTNRNDTIGNALGIVIDELNK